MGEVDEVREGLNEHELLREIAHRLGIQNELLHQLTEIIETQGVQLSDLSAVVTQLQTAQADLTAAVQEAASRVSSDLDTLKAQISTLEGQLAGGGVDPATVQAIKDVADSIETQVATLSNLDVPATPTPPAPAPTPPAPSGETLAITSTSLSGSVGAPYSASLSATGGAAPYVWSVSGLPDGLEADVNGNITGTPTTAGSYTLSVGVVDNNNSTASAQVTLAVS